MFYLSDLFEEISGKSRSSWKIDRGERQDNKHVRTGFSHLVVSFATLVWVVCEKRILKQMMLKGPMLFSDPQKGKPWE